MPIDPESARALPDWLSIAAKIAGMFAAFVGGGVAIWFVSVVTSGVLQSRSVVIAEITIGLCIGACLGVIAWGVHVLVPNYAFKPTAEEAAQRIQAPSRGGGLT